MIGWPTVRSFVRLVSFLIDKLELVIPVLQLLHGEFGETSVIGSHPRIDVVIIDSALVDAD